MTRTRRSRGRGRGRRTRTRTTQMRTRAAKHALPPLETYLVLEKPYATWAGSVGAGSVAAGWMWKSI